MDAAFRILVFGDSTAALSAALRLHELGASVDLVTPSVLLQAGERGADRATFLHFGDDAGCETLYKKMIECGEGLADESLLRRFCEWVPQSSNLLLRLGVPVERTAEGSVKRTGSEAAQEFGLVSAPGGIGSHVRRELALQVLQRLSLGRLRLFERTELLQLVQDDHLSCRGVVLQDLADTAVQTMPVDAVILADGGMDGLFDFPLAPVQLPWGLALQYRSGGSLLNPEFVSKGDDGTGGGFADARFRSGIDSVYLAGDLFLGWQGARMLSGNLVHARLFTGVKSAEMVWEDLQKRGHRDVDLNLLEQAGVCAEAEGHQHMDACGPEIVRQLHADGVEILCESCAELRTAEGMTQGLTRLSVLRERLGRVGVTDSLRRYNQEIFFLRRFGGMLDLTHAILQAAVLRRESRGTHQHRVMRERNDETYRRITRVSLEGVTPRVRYEELTLPARASVLYRVGM